MIDLPELQSQLISLLTPIESRRQTDSATSLEAMTLEATLNLAHSGKPHILVNDIANEVNRITRARRTASLQRRDDRAQHKEGRPAYTPARQGSQRSGDGPGHNGLCS